MLKQRLDIVDSSQQHQFEELQEIAHSTFRGSLPGCDIPNTQPDNNVAFAAEVEDDLNDYEDDYEDDDSDSFEKADVEKCS